MHIFNKSDLRFSYTWTTTSTDDPKLIGNPDRVFLNRQEGYEVLKFIQTLMGDWGFKKVESGHRLEKLIHQSPTDLRSKENIKEWIRSNW